MMLYTVAIVLVHTVLAVQAGLPFMSRPADDVEALCSGKSVALLTLAELEHLNSIVGHSSCSSNVKAAVPDLFALVKETMDDVCAQASIDKMRNFYVKYLDTSAEANKQREELPKSLKRFGLAYGMQMSALCKWKMFNVLIDWGHKVLYSDAHEVIKNLVSTKSPVADMLEGLAGPDEFVLPGDLAPYLKDKKQADGDDIIYVQSATGPYIREMQNNCTQKFAPLYKPAIAPVVQLANMGFNYRDNSVRTKLKSSETSEELAKWSRLVFLCESLNNIHMVDVPDKPNPEDPAGKTVRILTKEEAAAIEGESVGEVKPEVVEHKMTPVIIKKVEEIMIVNKYDGQLTSAIKAFSTSKSESEKAAKRISAKGLSMLKAQLKRGNFGVLLSTGYKSLVNRIRTGENLKPSDEIVKVLDGAIGHESSFQDDEQTNEWAGVKKLARDLGSFLAAAVMGILFIALWSLAIASIALNIAVLASG